MRRELGGIAMVKSANRLKTRPVKKESSLQPKTLVDAVTSRMASNKRKKIAKSFSIEADHFRRLEMWCHENDEVPSRVVDNLIAVFLDQKEVQ